MTKTGLQHPSIDFIRVQLETQSLDIEDVVPADKAQRQEMNLLPNAASYL